MTHKPIITAIGQEAPPSLYLVPGDFEGEPALLWCEDPAPSNQMDPAEAVKYIRVDCLRPLMEEMERRGRVRPGNSPGHSHAVPGIWDKTGNPEHRGGQVCEWCRMWNETKALLATCKESLQVEELSEQSND